MLTYDHLLNSSHSPAYFARVCGLSSIRHWRKSGIPAQYHSKIKKILASENNSLSNIKHGSNAPKENSNENRDLKNSESAIPLGFAQNLGILRNNPNLLENKNLPPIELPKITPQEKDVLDARFRKYLRQNAAQKLLPNRRVASCLRKKIHTDVSVKRVDGGRSYFADLFRCSSLWDCPCCASKISEVRRNEAVLATTQHREQYGKNSVLFLTFTYSHHRIDVLKDLVTEQKAAFKWLFDNCRNFRFIRKLNGYVGNIRALECTHGENNGWHPHVHFLFFFDQNFNHEQIEQLKKQLFPLWEQACARVGLGTPTFERGLDIQDGSYAADYISKWGMEDEVFKTATKKGRIVDGKQSRSPFQLLDAYLEGDKNAGKLFQEYVEVFAGSRQQRWSKGLKARFNLKEVTDQEIVDDTKAGHLFAMIPADDWRIIEKQSQFNIDLRSNLLALADLGDIYRFWAYVDYICGRDYTQRLIEPSAPILSPQQPQPEPSPQIELELEPLPVNSPAVPNVTAMEFIAQLQNDDKLNQQKYDQSSLFSRDFDFLADKRQGRFKGKNPLQVLKDVFGYDDFRGLQHDVINHVTAGKSALMLAATGAGKSICYQIPMLCRGGLGVVVSPLKSLMKDQIKPLRDKGIKAEYLNSDLTEKRIQAIEQRIIDGDVEILYISPERLSQQRTIDFLSSKQICISLFAIDEAHCISQWGHDFRADYLSVRLLAEKFPHVPRLALTATADKQTRADIVQYCGLDNAKQFITDFDRPNIDYQVKLSTSVGHSLNMLLDYVLARPQQTGIVYCSSRQKVDDIVEQLKERGIDALGYHSGMTKTAKEANQHAFLTRPVVIVATIAFGMGIDKANVRYVLHFDLSNSIEAFYQESGRAGRDGLPSQSLVIYNPAASMARMRHMKTESERLRFALMLDYCQQDDKRNYLLDFFN